MRIARTLAVNTTALAVNTTALAANTDGAHREHEQAAAMGSVFWPGGLVDGARREHGRRSLRTHGRRSLRIHGWRST